MCILCDLLRDAGWADSSAHDGELALTDKGKARIMERLQRDYGQDYDLTDPAVVLMLLEKLAEAFGAPADHDKKASIMRDAQRVAQVVQENLSLQGGALFRAMVLPGSSGHDKLREQLAEQLEMAKLLGQVPADTTMTTMEVSSHTFRGKVYSWNLTQLRSWCLQNQERWERWHLGEAGLAQEVRAQLDARTVDMEEVARLDVAEAKRLPIVVAEVPYENTNDHMILDGVERATRLLMSRQFEADVVLLSREESAQFILVDGAPI